MTGQQTPAEAARALTVALMGLGALDPVQTGVRLTELEPLARKAAETGKSRDLLRLGTIIYWRIGFDEFQPTPFLSELQTACLAVEALDLIEQARLLGEDRVEQFYEQYSDKLEWIKNEATAVIDAAAGHC